MSTKNSDIKNKKTGNEKLGIGGFFKEHNKQVQRDVRLVKKTDSPYGLDALISLSYTTATIGHARLSDKRKLVFSMYCLRCLFDNADLLDPPPILVEYGCSFLFEPVFHPDFTDTDLNAEKRAFFKAAMAQTDAVLMPGGGLLIEYCGQKMLKLDAGSPLFDLFVNSGAISGEFAAYPQKFGLLEAVFILLSLPSCSNELKALWFLLYPFLLGGVGGNGGDGDGNFHNLISQLLRHEKIYEAASFCDYADVVPDSPFESFASDPFLADWFMEYVEWRKKHSEGNNQTKIFTVPPFANKASEEDCVNSLAYSCRPTTNTTSLPKKPCIAPSDLSTNSDAHLATNLDANPDIDPLIEAERIFAASPQNEDALILLLAARTNLPKESQPPALLNENIRLITDFLPAAKNRALLTYYLGLSFLALGSPDKARRAFEICLTFKPDFKPAAIMIASLNSKTAQSDK